MRGVLFALAMMILLAAAPALAAPSYAQAYSGTAGVDSTGASAPVPQMAPSANQPAPVATLPPVFQGATPPSAPAAPALPPMAYPGSGAASPPTMLPAPSAVPGALDAAALPPDPCAAYINSYDAYAVCQDRMQRLQRMKDARTKRAEAAEAVRQRAEERRAARNAPPPEPAPKMRRPGQVAPAAAPPLQVQVVPAEPAAPAP